MINALPYPVSIHDTTLKIVISNQIFKDFYSLPGDIPETPCHQIIHCQSMPKENCPALKTLQSGKAEKAEIQEPNLKKNLLINTSPLYHQEVILGVIHTVTDITELRASINELTEREATLRRSRDAFFNMLEDINESYNELKSLFMSLVRAMVNALDAKSPWTRGHSERVADYAERIAQEMGLDENKIKCCSLAGLLHDIGKLGTYDYLLNKPDSLTNEEIEIIRKHPLKGAEILQDIKQLKEIIPYIRHHHERIDGKGYPDGLKGEDIPLIARILHVADSFDAMTSCRPYRPTPNIEYAVNAFLTYRGSQFDPQIVTTFLNILKKEKRIGDDIVVEK